MNTLSKAFILPDTNAALHYLRIDQIDWISLTNAESVAIVIAPVFVRELERQKVFNPSKKLRDRAARLIVWLNEQIDRPDPNEIRPGTVLLAIDHEPLTIDFAAQRLSPTLEDDHLIASALELSDQVIDRLVYIATADLGMKIKLRTRSSLRLLNLPEMYRANEEPDPTEQELRRTRQRLHQLENRLPILGVRFSASHNTRLNLLPHDPLADMDVLTPDENRAQYPLRTYASPGSGLALQLYRATEQSVREHNEILQEYHEKYDAYYQEYRDWVDLTARAYVLELEAYNRGTAPAKDVHVVLRVPDDMRILVNLPDLPNVQSHPILASLDTRHQNLI
jgi:hypothetical protein